MRNSTTPVATSSSQPLKLKDRIEDNLVVFFLGTLMTGFVAGLGTYQAAMKIIDYEPVPSKPYRELKEASTHKSAPVTQHWLRILGVRGLAGSDVRIVANVNGHAFSYPSQTVWSRVRSDMSNEDFALPSDTDEYSISFHMLVLDRQGRYQEYASHEDNYVEPSKLKNPYGGSYDLWGIRVGAAGSSRGSDNGAERVSVIYEVR